jgi:hypothetical protein
MNAPVRGVDAPDGLNFLTGFHTTTAFDAFVHVAYKSFAFHNWPAASLSVMRFFVAAKRRFPNVKIRRKLLQFAVCIADTSQAILGMIGQNQLNDHFSDGSKAAVMGNDIYAFPYLVGTGGYKFPPAVTFHHADAAVRPFAQVGVFAESGDMYIHGSGGIQNPGAFRYTYRYAVNG